MTAPKKSNAKNAVPEKNSDIDIFHIDVLDGIRALAILIVVWFHLWQQCWLSPVIRTPALSFLGISQISLDWLPRTGYVMVTMMIFLSGFCLFLPHARNMICGEKLAPASLFYKKRVARILPSYLFCVIAVFIYDIATNAYGSGGFMAKDLITHLTFTFNLFPDTYESTLLNGVLWTVALEVQFYIIFPAIARCFRKRPVLTYVVMNAISVAYIIYAQMRGNPNILLHQLPSYLGVYANGFAGAQIFVGISKKIKREKYSGLISTITSLGCVYVYYVLMKRLCEAGNINGWQLHNRYLLSVLFMIFVISTALSLSFYRKIFSCRVMRFFGTISFNLYIWHQFAAVTLKKHRIPEYYGDTPPNQTGDRVWMWQYFILCVVAAFVMAVLATYLIEKPCSKLIMKIKARNPKSKSKGKPAAGNPRASGK